MRFNSQLRYGQRGAEEDRNFIGTGLAEKWSFSLSAQLRAGALYRKRKPQTLIPINSYAQYVVKFTVAHVVDPTTGKGTPFPTSGEAVISEPSDEQRIFANAPPAPVPWWKISLPNFNFTLIAAIIGILLVILILVFPGFGSFAYRVFRSLVKRFSRKKT